MMRRTYIAIIVLFSIAFVTEAITAPEHSISSQNASRLTLNIYLDSTGNALVTGYAENPERWAFLKSSQYSYENETSQLYALTNALTRKDGDTWAITFASPGHFEDYHVTFYLPSDFKIKNVSRSQGLEYVLSYTSNNSLALDFQGYGVSDPVASIEYMQPLETRPSPTFRPTDLMLLIMALAVAAAMALGWRYMARLSQRASPDDIGKPASSQERNDVTAGAGTEHMSTSLTGNLSEIASETGTGTSAENIVLLEQPSDQLPHYETHVSSEPEELGETNIDDEKEIMTEDEIQDLKTSAEKINVTSEMATVMETLTPRERIILQALIDLGGRSTQRDLRYETLMPKSTVADIINSLEKRKLIIKKEWGRTNIIELSELFLPKKG